MGMSSSSVSPSRLSAAAVYAAVLCINLAVAQELEPRAYANAPTGVNFLSLAYGWSNGNVLLDPALPIENLDAEIHVGVVSVSHAFALRGSNAKIKMALPWTTSSWLGTLEGIPAEQEEQGMGDAWIGFDWLFSGAPALSVAEFGSYHPDLLLGLGLRLSLPTGDYNPENVLNLGSRRFSLRTELAASQTYRDWTFEGVAGVRIFGKNDEFLGDRTLEQEPLWSLKGSVIYTLPRPGWWTSFSVAYGVGGRTRLDGVSKNNEQKNWRFGASFAFPVAARHGLSIRINTGINDGAGSDFDSVTFAYTFQTDPL